MIETHADARRLSSIDAATSLGRLADEVVVAASRRIAGIPLAPEDARALHTASGWLTCLSDQLAKPLDVSYIGATGQLPGLYGFGPDVTGAAIGAIGLSADRDEEVEVLHRLRDMTNAVASEGSDPEGVERVLEVFESIARAMLSAAGSLLNSPNGSTWPKTFAF
jgi:hypothetical protein